MSSLWLEKYWRGTCLCAKAPGKEKLNPLVKDTQQHGVTSLIHTHIHHQQIFIRWKIPSAGSKESGDNWQALLHKGEEALLAVEMGTYDTEGQGLLLDFGHLGSSSPGHSVSPVLARKGLQCVSSAWVAVLPVLAGLGTFPWSLLQCAPSLTVWLLQEDCFGLFPRKSLQMYRSNRWSEPLAHGW